MRMNGHMMGRNGVSTISSNFSEVRVMVTLEPTVLVDPIDGVTTLRAGGWTTASSREQPRSRLDTLTDSSYEIGE